MAPSHSTVANLKIEKGAAGAVWDSVQVTADLAGFEKGTESAAKGISWEIRLYRNVKKIEFKYRANKEILTEPEALYVTFPFSLPDSQILFETIGGILAQGQQLPGSSSDWNAAQGFVAVRNQKAQIIVVSNEVPLWHFSDFNMGKFERYPKPGKTWLYSWVMNNYWFTNFRAFQEGGFSWSYQITSAPDNSNTYATQFSWGQRSPFLTRTFPAGKNELDTPAGESLRISGSPHVLLVNSRPVFPKAGTILLHFRELEGQAGEVKISSSMKDRPIHSLTEVNALGKEMGGPLASVSMKPYEVKFIEVRF